ncbi:MAG: hypothetical protein NT160_06115 [Actinobacteria bacterium]|nr:hypothetical protein [Actinomycetota bacterium]
MGAPAGYWQSPWPGEDAGPRRLAAPHGGGHLGLTTGKSLLAHHRDALVATMVVLRNPGEVYLLCHSGGDDAISWVEQVDALSLETIRRSPDLPGGRTWPGGLAAHADGSLYVVFGRYAHCLSAELDLLASQILPRDRPYNSFVILEDGHLATKDFSGALPAGNLPNSDEASQLIVLAPGSLAIVDSLDLPEPSVARLSAQGSTVYVVGERSFLRVQWNGKSLSLDDQFRGEYLSLPGQTYGWDAVIAEDAAWFLDNGAGTEAYAGSFINQGISPEALHLVRVDLEDARVSLTEICGLANGIVANPPIVDMRRRIVVGYDSANGVLAAFDIAKDGSTSPRWSVEQNHACHALLFSDSGELVSADYDAIRMEEQLVVRSIESGIELGRIDSGSPVSSAVFMAAGFNQDLYYCSFTTLTRISVV